MFIQITRTAMKGGRSGNGTVFKLNTDGTGFLVLYNFSAGTLNALQVYVNTDGVYPRGLVLVGDVLYGTAFAGGSWGSGTIFRIKTDGTGFNTLHSFAASSGFFPGYTNSDGINPMGLVLDGEILYGVARLGGSSGSGTIFKIRTDGTAFEAAYSFTATSLDPSLSLRMPTNSDGANPSGRLVIEKNTLYGTAMAGGSGGTGTVFSYALPPPRLTIRVAGANILLAWPTNAAGFTLQSTTNLFSPAFWTPVPPGPVVTNNQDEVTIPFSGAQHFYRLH